MEGFNHLNIKEEGRSGSLKYKTKRRGKVWIFKIKKEGRNLLKRKKESKSEFLVIITVEKKREGLNPLKSKKKKREQIWFSDLKRKNEEGGGEVYFLC